MNNLRQLLGLGVLLFTAVSSLHADAPDQPPKGLSSSDWSTHRAAFDARRHRITALAGGLQARNHGQQWRTLFDGQGFLVQPDGADSQWGLELTAYGFSGHEHTLPTGRATTLAEVAGPRLDNARDAGLSEWFVNDTHGLEHGFTVHERPDGRAPEAALKFHLAIRGDLRPVLEPDGRGVRFVDAHGTTRTTYAGLKEWEADGQLLPARFGSPDAGHPGEIALAVDERVARYPLTIDPIAQQAYLKASNTGVGDQFGTAVAISGDTLVVGAPFESSDAKGINGDDRNNNAVASGAAYVFMRSSGVWTQQAFLKASNAEIGDQFGRSVAVSGDTIVVGAFGENSSATGINGDGSNANAPGSGAAYVFVRSAGVWTQQAFLKASNTGVADRFGGSVAVSGDTVVVGASGESSNATGVNGNQGNNRAFDAGAAYVFVRTGETWSQQAYLKASNTGATDHFGHSVAVSGDTVVVGAFGEGSDASGINGDGSNDNAPDSGAAYVFVRTATMWAQQAYLKASNSGAFDDFGYSVAVSGDTAAVGARYEAGSATGVNGDGNNDESYQSGAAYVFVRNDGKWTQQAYLKSSNTEVAAPGTGPRDYFGHSVAVSGDTVVVGAWSEDSGSTGVNGNGSNNNAEDSGAAYVFVRSDGSWTQQAYLKAHNTGVNDEFGFSVAVSNDTAVVGAIGESSEATGVNGDGSGNSFGNSGAAYIFSELGPSGRPEIAVELPSGADLRSGTVSAEFEAAKMGSSSDLVFTVKNSGLANLTGLGLTISGPDANQFSVSANLAPALSPGGSTTFSLRFSPTSNGTKTAAVHIASNDADENPFIIVLVGNPETAAVTTSGSDFIARFPGAPGRRYRVQYALGFDGQWNDFIPPALYTAPANGVFSHTDANPPDILRLYRAVLAP